MILHIIKKDLRLLWPFVAGLAALNAMGQWLHYRFSVLGTGTAWPIFVTVAVIGWIVLVAMLVHQDVIPGTRQDWLTRPIKRRDLIAAKLLFAIGLLQFPLFAMMTVEVLAAGYSLQEAVGAAFARSVAAFIVLTLPAFALAAVTRNFVETAVAALVVAIVAEAAAIALDGVTGEPCGATCGSGLAWVGIAARIAVVVIGGLAVIGVQYFRRGATASARAALLVAAVGFVVAGRWSWGSAFSIQRAVTGEAAEPASVAISLDRARPPAPPTADDPVVMAARSRLAGMEPGALLEEVVSRRLQGTTVALPLRVAGQPAGSVLWADRVEIRLLDSSGRVVYRGRGDELEIRAGATGVAQTVLIPTYVFNAYRSSELRAELDYWLTSLEARDTVTLPVSNGAARLASGEQCSTRSPRAGNAVTLTCLGIRRPPACYSAALEGSADLLVCAPSYWPDALWRNLFARFAIDVPIGAGARIDTPSLRLVTYEPRDHFTARIVVPGLRLADWVTPPSR